MTKKEIITSSVLLVVIIGIYSAYTLIMGKSEKKPEEKIESVEILNPVETEIPDENIEPEQAYYFVKSDSNLLVLYEVQGESRKKIKSFQISPEMFPAEDRELLRTGIKALTLEDGIKIMENFIS